MTFIPNIQNSWKDILESEFSKDYFKGIENKINEDKNN
jgi:uracil DNA glycosylase